VSEGAAYGAALQALWAWRQAEGEATSIHDITEQFVRLNSAETAEPIAKNVAMYEELQELQNELSTRLRDVFLRHREVTTKGQK
jgi:xylulokinase